MTLRKTEYPAHIFVSERISCLRRLCQQNERQGGGGGGGWVVGAMVSLQEIFSKQLHYRCDFRYLNKK